MPSWTVDLIKNLWPPSGNEDPTIWRRVVFVVTIILTFLLGTHLLAAKGFLLPLGIEPLPTMGHLQEHRQELIALDKQHKRDVQEIRDNQKSILYAIYAPQIRSLVRDRCEADTASQRENINKILDRVLDDYRQAAGRDFEPMPGCNDV